MYVGRPNDNSFTVYIVLNYSFADAILVTSAQQKIKTTAVHKTIIYSCVDGRESADNATTRLLVSSTVIALSCTGCLRAHVVSLAKTDDILPLND